MLQSRVGGEYNVVVTLRTPKHCKRTLMATDTVKLFSTIKPSLLRNSLMRGSIAALLGVLLLILAAAYLPPSAMMHWGLPILLAGGGLMVYGLIPYRRLIRMEEEPNELLLIGENCLQLFSFGKLQYTLPMAMIHKTEYFDAGNDYGIAIWFSEGGENKIIVHNHRLNMARCLSNSRKRYGCDLFIPYFGRRSYMRLALFSEGTSR